MSRIAARFEALRARQRKALVPYITAGDPEPRATVPLMHAMVATGADIVELGVPFSDPMADGPTIQAACERALQHKVSLRRVLEMVREFRERDSETPVVLMGYLNPIERMGYGAFAKAAREAGADGVITVDLPPEEAGDLAGVFKAASLDPIFLLAPTSPRARIERICAAASGFVYYVSLKGVTGAASLDAAAVAQKLAEIRAVTRLPIGVGFGIKDAASASRIARIADAVVVGSAVVQRIADHVQDVAAAEREIVKLLKSMREAMDDETRDARVA